MNYEECAVDLVRAKEEIDDLRAEAERLREDSANQLIGIVSRNRRIDELDARCGELEAALRPFVAVAHWVDAHGLKAMVDRDGVSLWEPATSNNVHPRITYQHCDKARTALGAKP